MCLVIIIFKRRIWFLDPHPPKLNVEDSQLLYATKGTKIWKDKNDVIEKLPAVLENQHFFQISSKGHKNKAYSVTVLNETALYLGIRKNAGKNDKAIKDAISFFTKGDSKNQGIEQSQWTKEEMDISADCCEFWVYRTKEIQPFGLLTITLPTIKTEEFPFTIFIAGIILRS